ncbi:MAG: alpha/beta hydrolase, partial [Phycisphaerales bacterium]
TQTDPLEFQYADQGRIDIEEGDLVTTDDGTSARWRRVEAVKPGEFADPALRGGYALIRIKRDEPGVQVIEATGHSMMRVNGQPRVGDIYRTGMVKLPVELKAGVNDILVHCVRGEFEFQLRPARGRAELNLDDPTIPDLLTDRTSHDEAAVVILNAHAERLRGGTIEASTAHAEPIRTKIPDILSLSTRKVPFALPDIDTQQGESSVDVMLRLLDADGEVLDHDTLSLRVREPHQSHRRTFRSGIDGSLQYYAVQPATGMMQDENGEEVEAPSPPGLVLSLHGASVEAISQARSYEPKSWTHIVAPTNRRPFGFDWEDWGRIDAMEVLEVAERELRPDPLRRYLTGHSMGGHGTWQIGVHYPDRFAAIGPSASWISFWSYTGAAEYDEDHPHEAMLKRAVSPSDTLALESNLARYAIYILHGDEDESVPVEQARIMRERLGRFHTNFSYYERPGAGHWWGSQCMDWPPMFEMFERERLTPSDQRDAIDFTTATPGISASADWITIHAPQAWLKPARVQVSRDRELRLFFGETTNIARLAIELVGLEEGEPVSVELDDTHFDDIDWPESGALYFERAESDGAWQVAAPFDPQQKGPHRAGLFKSAFDHHMVFVIGTQGTEEENTWAFHKARYDAETFWYRGNGAVDIVADVDFDASADPDRNVILYGHAGMNAAWTEVIDDDELHVERDRVRLGDRELTGATRSVLAIRPRRGSAHASVGIVAGTGLPGLRATERMPYFVSGVAYPDVFIYDADLWSVGIEAVRASGFFCTDWSVANGDIAWTE